MSPEKHAVNHLFDKRLAQSTRPFRARGADVIRCPICRVDQRHCICHLRPETTSNAAFLLLYYDDEILKPSNTGRLIADLFTDTYAFIWNRTDVQPELLDVLNNPLWAPMVVFPAEHAQAGRVVHDKKPALPQGKRPLFILLDGSWREARKMFRKSPYLDDFPVFSVSPEQNSAYQVRKAVREHQLATAEVASYLLGEVGEPHNAELLKTWFEVFSYRYQKGVTRTNRGDAGAETRLEALQDER